MHKITMSDETKHKVYTFLNELRLSGKINMYGSAEYVMKKFKFDKDTTRELVLEWMKNFTTNKTT